MDRASEGQDHRPHWFEENNLRPCTCQHPRDSGPIVLLFPPQVLTGPRKEAGSQEVPAHRGDCVTPWAQERHWEKHQVSSGHRETHEEEVSTTDGQMKLEVGVFCAAVRV